MKKIGFQRHRFSEELKLGVLKQVTCGNLSATEACASYGVSRTTMYRWLNKLSKIDNSDNLGFQNHIKLSKEKEANSESELLKRKISALEKSLEYEKLRSEAYQTMIEIAEKEFSIQIGKKSGAKQSKR